MFMIYDLLYYRIQAYIYLFTLRSLFLGVKLSFVILDIDPPTTLTWM